MASAMQPNGPGPAQQPSNQAVLIAYSRLRAGARREIPTEKGLSGGTERKKRALRVLFCIHLIRVLGVRGYSKVLIYLSLDSVLLYFPFVSNN